MSRIRYILFAIIISLVSFGAMAVPVDINTANAETLAAELTGIGSAKAQAIVAYREKHGPFRQAEDLLQIKGIGDAILEKNRDSIVINTK